MSTFYERNIWAFTLLLENKPKLFSDQDRIDLNDLDKVLIKNLKQISGAIENWVDSHPGTELEEVYVTYLRAINSARKSVICGDTDRGVEKAEGQPAPPPPPEAELRQQLTNAIRRNRPASTQPKPKSDEKSK